MHKPKKVKGYLLSYEDPPPEAKAPPRGQENDCQASWPDSLLPAGTTHHSNSNRNSNSNSNSNLNSNGNSSNSNSNSNSSSSSNRSMLELRRRLDIARRTADSRFGAHDGYIAVHDHACIEHRQCCYYHLCFLVLLPCSCGLHS